MLKLLFILFIIPLSLIISGIILILKKIKKNKAEEVKKNPILGIVILAFGIIWTYFAIKKMGF